MKVIIFGISDFAKQINHYLSQQEGYEVMYFCVNKEYYFESEFIGKKVLIFEEDLDNLSKSDFKFIISIGYKEMRARKKIFDMIKKKGFSFINYIHPTSNIMGEIVGEGNIILANTIIEPFSKVHNNNIIWSNALICHDSVVGNHNFIGALSIVGGFSKINDNNFLGFNSVVKDNIIVNKEVLIGAKSLVLKNTTDYSCYYGTPAKKVKEHEKEGIQI